MAISNRAIANEHCGVVFSNTHLPRIYSKISASKSSDSTLSPFSTRTRVTVPAIGALISVSIFMALSLNRVWPSFTSSPDSTRTSTIDPGIGVPNEPLLVGSFFSLLFGAAAPPSEPPMVVTVSGVLINHFSPLTSNVTVRVPRSCKVVG